MAPAVVLFHGSGPSAAALEWGALAGIGGGAGVVFLYEGFAVGRISSVATTSAVLTAVLPVLVGLALGDHLGAGAAIGIVIAIPAIALVSWQPAAREGQTRGSGTLYGVLSGAGFALLFVALDRAGTRAGAWPLVSCEVAALVPIAPFAYRALRSAGRPSPKVTTLFPGRRPARRRRKHSLSCGDKERPTGDRGCARGALPSPDRDPGEGCTERALDADAGGRANYRRGRGGTGHDLTEART